MRYQVCRGQWSRWNFAIAEIEALSYCQMYCLTAVRQPAEVENYVNWSRTPLADSGEDRENNFISSIKMQQMTPKSNSK